MCIFDYMREVNIGQYVVFRTIFSNILRISHEIGKGEFATILGSVEDLIQNTNNSTLNKKFRKLQNVPTKFANA